MKKTPQVQLDKLAEQPDLEDYRNKPVDNYGISLLKNMGFDKNKGIGKAKTNKPTEILVLKARPKGLGLGAETQQEKEKQAFENGDRVQIIKQPHKQLVGRILQVDEQNVEIQLDCSQSKVKVSLDSIRSISRRQMQSIVRQQRENRMEEKKKKRLKWIIPQIRVKIINKFSPNYLHKMLVTEVISERVFECRDQKGKVYTHFTQKDVQTVVPKPGAKVCLLNSRNSGQIATVLQRKKGKNKMTVQTIQELQIMQVQEDDVAQYVQI